MATTPNRDSRIRGALLGLAVCDALGAPVEFKQRGSFPPVVEMMPNTNFGTPKGAFTDDTSMALCLAHSLLDNKGKHNSVDQAEKYLAWRDKGFMSSVGQCFDIGNSTNACLTRWQDSLDAEINHLKPGSPAAEAARFTVQDIIRGEFNREKFCGNGSLMRVLPVALIAPTPLEAIGLATQSSLVTHPHARCVGACTLYTRLVREILEVNPDAGDKQKLASYFSGEFRGAAGPEDEVLRSRLSLRDSLPEWQSIPEQKIRSSGYVVDSLEAALWSFFTTSTFEEGAIKAVNLGDDADTVGAIYGGLAGSFYGAEAIPDRWLNKMKRLDLVEDVVTKIIEYRNSDTPKYSRA